PVRPCASCFAHPPPTECSPLSLRDALPISAPRVVHLLRARGGPARRRRGRRRERRDRGRRRVRWHHGRADRARGPRRAPRGVSVPIRAGHLLKERYELTSRIAVGGMGEVWRAHDRLLGRTVAAKVLREDLVDDDASLARLRAEARNASGVVHPNVAVVLDYGEQDGGGFLVMEYVPGEPLSRLLARERTLPPHRLLPVLAQCARGLQAVHDAGVVHRDVKPSNVLLTPDGTVKLTDFGISLGVDQPALTAAGMVMGTAQYLPPELAMGRPAQPAGDIYALGVIAYEALAGRRPFTGATQVDIAMAHVTTPLPPLPDGVPPPVRELVSAMLAKDPADRPP